MADNPTASLASRRTFNLDTGLRIGPITERVVEGKSLFIDPVRACWITLESEEAAAFRRLARGETMRTVLTEEPGIDRGKLANVLSGAIHAGFLGDRINFADQTRRKQVQIHLTNRCNLRCVHCYMDSGVRIIPETGTQRWRDLLNALAERYNKVFCSFSGGEPLLSQSLIPLLEHANALGIKSAIITNGLLLEGECLERLKPFLDVCAISLDGLSPETHDQIRGKGAFDRTYRNLLNLADSPFRKVLNITALRTNKEELATKLRDFVDSLSFKVDIDLGTLVYEGRAVGHSDLALSHIEFNQLLLHIARVFVQDQLLGESAIGTRGNVLWKSLPSRARLSCGYGDSLVVYSNGDVSPCLTPRFIRGNIFRDDPGKLLAVLEEERAAAHVDRLEDCKTCDLRHICGGRCHLAQLRAGQLPSQVECPQSYKDSMFKNLVRWGSSAA